MRLITRLKMGIHIFGRETLIDFKGSPLVNSSVVIQEFVDDLCNKIDMKKFGNCNINYFGDPSVEGYSFFQLIETSNISGHLCSNSYMMTDPETGKEYDSKGNGYINIFSCKDYDIDKAVKVVQEHFKPTSLKHSVIDRV